MEMTADQRAVMAHVVMDPDAWLAHAVATFGEEKAAQFLDEKVERHRDAYEAAAAQPGYQTRAEREAEE